MTTKFRMVYDIDLKRPACVLIQASMGGDTAALKHYFPNPEDWLLTPTEGMRLLEGEDSTWQCVVEITKKRKEVDRYLHNIEEKTKHE